MRKEFLPFSRPSITAAEVDEVRAALESGWISSGPRVEEFERAFAAHLGVPHALAVSSATAGLQILLRALGIGPGDEVITASLTWPSAANMIQLSGARPLFADVDRRTLQMDPAGLESLATPRTRAVIPVHFAGQPADLEEIGRFCSERGLILIEDAAHAIGAEHRGRRIGSGGNPAVFSFHAIKNLTTGEGGMITTADGALLERLRRLRFHGVDRDAWRRHAEITRGGYDLAEPGWKCNLTDVQAALGLAQLRRLEELIRRRTELARLYDDLLGDIPELERPEPAPYPVRHAWHLYVVMIGLDRAGIGRDEFREELRRRNIGTGLHFPAVHRLSFYRERFPVPPGSLANTERAAERILSLPLFPDMSEDDVAGVAEAIREILGHHG